MQKKELNCTNCKHSTKEGNAGVTDACWARRDKKYPACCVLKDKKEASDATSKRE